MKNQRPIDSIGYIEDPANAAEIVGRFLGRRPDELCNYIVENPELVSHILGTMPQPQIGPMLSALREAEFSPEQRVSIYSAPGVLISWFYADKDNRECLKEQFGVSVKNEMGQFIPERILPILQNQDIFHMTLRFGEEEVLGMIARLNPDDSKHLLSNPSTFLEYYKSLSKGDAIKKFVDPNFFTPGERAGIVLASGRTFLDNPHTEALAIDAIKDAPENNISAIIGALANTDTYRMLQQYGILDVVDKALKTPEIPRQYLSGVVSALLTPEVASIMLGPDADANGSVGFTKLYTAILQSDIIPDVSKNAFAQFIKKECDKGRGPIRAGIVRARDTEFTDILSSYLDSDRKRTYWGYPRGPDGNAITSFGPEAVYTGASFAHPQVNIPDVGAPTSSPRQHHNVVRR